MIIFNKIYKRKRNVDQWKNQLKLWPYYMKRV